ncbi:MAG: LAGLIDADG family homing endonuclease [Methanothermobacter tenebrarum]
MSGADNQQERLQEKEVGMTLDVKVIPPRIGYYLAGFADGEGSFNVSFRPRNDYAIPWKVSLCFNISQKDKVILALYKKHLKCGTLRSRPDGVWYYEVNNFRAIVENVIPFFDRFGFLSAKKKRDFSKFKKIARIMQENRHLTKEGILEIVEIRKEMNDGGKRKHGEEDIKNHLFNEESSETIRQALPDDEEG